MLDRSQYPQYQTMQNYGIPSAQDAFRASEYAAMPDVNAAFNLSQQNLIGGTGYTPSNDFPFMKRPDALFAGQGSWMDSLKGMGQVAKDILPSGFLGSTDAKGIKTDGWGIPAITGVMSGLSAINAFKNYGLAEKSFNLQKDVAMANLNGTKQTTNTRYEDRQKARVASNPGGYESVDSYMKNNRIA